MPVLGLSVVLTEVKVDAYATGGTTDHLTPCRTSAPAAARSQRAESSWGDAMAVGHYPAPATRSHANRTNADRVP